MPLSATERHAEGFNLRSEILREQMVKELCSSLNAIGILRVDRGINTLLSDWLHRKL